MKRVRSAKNRAKRRMIGLAVTLVFLLALEVFLCVWYFGARYPAFDLLAAEEEEIPGMDEGLCPQGLCALPEGSGYRFAMSGYLDGGAPSRIVFLGGQTKYVTLTQAGAPVSTHFGGIACSGSFLFVASGKEMIRVSLQAALAAENGASIEIEDAFSTDMNNAFCSYENGNLYVGEFYRSGNYETQESHHITHGGETNRAFVYVYEGDESAAGGVVSTTPSYALSVRGQVQGIAVTKEKVYLSTSYGLPDSGLYVYENIASLEPVETYSFGGTPIPVYFLGSGQQRASLTMPCMSEEICIAGDRLYVLFESMANKYKYFVRVRMEHVVSFPLAELG